MALQVEGVVDGSMAAEKPLRRAGRFEPLHLALASSYDLMRIFGAIVEALMPAMLDTRHHSALGRAGARELVRDHYARCPALPLQQLAQQALGRFRRAALRADSH